MELKAFIKIYEEAEEAIAERRLFDALALTEAILKDTTYDAASQKVTDIRQQYAELLQQMASVGFDAHKSEVMQLFRSIIEALQKARVFWNYDHPQTLYALTAVQIKTLNESAIIDKLYHIRRSKVGDEAYHAELDAVFDMMWCTEIEPFAFGVVKDELLKSDSFARRTLIGALLLGLLECFNTQKLRLLLALAETQTSDNKQESSDIEAQLMVALTLIYQRYHPFFTYYTEEAQLLRTFFEQKARSEHIPQLLHAFTCQSLTDRVGKQVDDILPIIRDAFENQQRRLGSDDEEKKDKQKEPFSIEITEINLDSKTSGKLLDQMASYARHIDELREASLDVNFQSYSAMKNFPFFKHTAHWFYPFDINIPEIKDGVTRPNGKPDRFQLEIMNNSCFCDSDQYSYASLLNHMKRNGKNFISSIQDELDEMKKALENFVQDDAEEQRQHLPRMISFCQGLYRFHDHFRKQNIYTLNILSFNEKPYTPILQLPLFCGLFKDGDALSPSIDVCINMGAYEQAVALLDYSSDHFGADARLLYSRGYCLMHLQQWHRAIDAFQQQQLMDNSPEALLCMVRCFEALGQWDRALPLLRTEAQRLIDAKDEKAANIIEETGRCLIQLQQWDEAVQYFFRLEFMEQHLNVARRAIAWCSIHQGKYERAANYYRTLIEKKKAKWDDYLNLGHALWLQQLTAEAIEAYKKSQVLFNHTKKEQRSHFAHWTEAFREDTREFLAEHFNEMECALMMDAVSSKS